MLQKELLEVVILLDEPAHALHGCDCQVVPTIVHVADARVFQPVVDDADAFVTDLTVRNTDSSKRLEVASCKLKEVLANYWWHFILGEADSLNLLLFQRCDDDLKDFVFEICLMQ